MLLNVRPVISTLFFPAAVAVNLKALVVRALLGLRAIANTNVFSEIA
ncbi:MAG: hypothetical protein WCJ45_06830 [bacterium]